MILCLEKAAYASKLLLLRALQGSSLKDGQDYYYYYYYYYYAYLAARGVEVTQDYYYYYYYYYYYTYLAARGVEVTQHAVEPLSGVRLQRLAHLARVRVRAGVRLWLGLG